MICINTMNRFSPIEREDFYQNIFDIVYGNTKPTTDTLRPHKLAIFFAILAIGLIWNTDPSTQFIRDQYDFLARAAFSLAPISRSVTTITAQALFLINRFLNNGYRALQEECWLLHGVNSRVSQIVGLRQTLHFGMLLTGRYTLDWIAYVINDGYN